MTNEERAYNYASTQKPTKLQVGEIAKHYNNGYDQAFQDFLEKASKYLFDNLPHTWDITQTVSFIDNFKNYMKNEM